MDSYSCYQDNQGSRMQKHSSVFIAEFDPTKKPSKPAAHGFQHVSGKILPRQACTVQTLMANVQPTWNMRARALAAVGKQVGAGRCFSHTTTWNINVTVGTGTVVWTESNFKLNLLKVRHYQFKPQNILITPRVSLFDVLEGSWGTVIVFGTAVERMFGHVFL